MPMPIPPKPAVQETRRQPTTRAPRQFAAAPTAGSKQMISPRPATKSVLTRPAQPAQEEVKRANHTDSVMKKPAAVVKRTSATVPVSESTTQSARPSAAIPHNPLR